MAPLPGAQSSILLMATKAVVEGGKKNIFKTKKKEKKKLKQARKDNQENRGEHFYIFFWGT